MSFEQRDYLRHILAEADYLTNHSAGLTADRFMRTTHFDAHSSGVSRSSEKQQRRYLTISEHDIRLLIGGLWLECVTGSYMITSDGLPAGMGRGPEPDSRTAGPDCVDSRCVKMVNDAAAAHNGFANRVSKPGTRSPRSSSNRPRSVCASFHTDLGQDRVGYDLTTRPRLLPSGPAGRPGEARRTAIIFGGCQTTLEGKAQIMKKAEPDKKPLPLGQAALEVLIEEITMDAYGDDEQLWAFRQAFEDNITLPVEGTVVGEPVLVMAFDYDGNERRGLTAKCRRTDGREHVVAAADVMMPASEGARYLAAYRKWMGLAPSQPSATVTQRKMPPTKTVLEISKPVELVILSVRQKAARCRILGSGLEVTLRATRLWDVVPGEIAVIRPSKQWNYAGHPYLSGKIESTRLNTGELCLVPLKLEARGLWDPAEEYWGEEGEPIDDWARRIIARGRRPLFEIEQVLPGMDPDDPDPDADPIGQAVDHKKAGDTEGASKILMDLCQADLRCLDAHAHLGNLQFDARPQDAIRHYEVGFRIGELSLGTDFEGVLSWGWIDNRPLLRCMHGFGLCLWRLRRFEQAAGIFDRMLWLNPSDNQGVRFIIGDVAAKVAWVDSKNR